MLALASVEGYHGYLMFVWMYGIFFGGMEVTLKTYCYERLKIKQYARGWGYIQGVRALPLLIGKNIHTPFVWRNMCITYVQFCILQLTCKDRSERQLEEMKQRKVKQS